MAQAITFEDVLEFNDSIMIDEKTRLDSFKTWPFKHGSCIKEKMAGAGFYKCNLKGDVDSVRCFVCFKTLDGWEESDDPFVEHGKLSPNCSFIKSQVPQKQLLLIDWITILKDRTINLHKLRLQNKMEQFEASLKKLTEKSTD